MTSVWTNLVIDGHLTTNTASITDDSTCSLVSPSTRHSMVMPSHDHRTRRRSALTLTTTAVASSAFLFFRRHAPTYSSNSSVQGRGHVQTNSPPPPPPARMLGSRPTRCNANTVHSQSLCMTIYWLFW